MEFRERLAAREVFSKTAREKNRLLPSPLAPSLAAACRPDPTPSKHAVVLLTLQFPVSSGSLSGVRAIPPHTHTAS
jgi:hypothetical protein